MATFSTNQVKHLYAAKAVDSNLDSIGDIKFIAVGDGQIAAKYVGYDGVVRTDLINLDSLKGKAVKASSMSEYLKSAYVASASAVAGQQYILKVTVDMFGGISYEDKGFIFADYKAKSGDAAKNVLAGLAVNLAKNASKAAYNKLINVYVTTADASDALSLGSNLWAVSERDAEATVAAYGSLKAIIIEAAEQPWILGRAPYEKLYFSVAADPIISSGVETSWASIVYDEAHPNDAIQNSKKIADLEYFCMGERGDQYRNVGWPNSFEFKPMVNPEAQYGYHVIELTWAYQGNAEDIQKSPKELVIVAPAEGATTYTVINAIAADINSAAGSTVVASLS